ncbi:MAG: hypothetical protein LC734_11715 [Acidobacteria bacterium]|nr:hypothetical protein [Acidobacteriota bacterium]
MKGATKVKVIKKDSVKRPKRVVAEPKSKRVAAREMVSTITSWVSDFQTKKRDETKLAIENFFVSHPAPSES